VAERGLRSPFWAVGWPYGLVVLLVLGLLYPLVFAGRCLYWGDLSLYFYPLYHVMAYDVRSGHLPLWNPFVNCGQPLLGNPQASVFYPSTLAYLVLPPWRAYTFIVVVHLILAGWGTYAYMLRLTNDRAASALSGLLFAGSGYVVARLQFPTMVQAMAYLPWLLWFVDRIMAQPQTLYGVGFSIAVALLLSAGHAQVAYMTLACLVAYVVARFWQTGVRSTSTLSAAKVLGWGIAVALLLNSVQLLPTLQLFRVSTRTHLTWAETNRFVLLPEQLLNFLMPRFFGSPNRGDYWGAGNAWEPCVFLGIPALCLALLAVASYRRRMAAWFYGWLALLSLLLALGRYGLVFWVAYYVVPGVSTFHDPARFAFLTTFALCILAGLGLRRLRDFGASPLVRGAIFVLACVQPALASGTFNPSIVAAALEAQPAFLAGVENPRSHRVYSALHQEVWQRYVNYTDYGPSDPTAFQWLTDTLEPNLGMRFGVQEASGYEPVPIRWVADVDALVRSALMRHQANLPELLSLFDARWLLLPQGTRYRHPGLAPLSVAGMACYRVRGNVCDSWLVRRTVRVDGTDRSLAAISEPGFNPQEIAVVSGSAGLDERAASLGEPLPPPARMRILQNEARTFIAEVDGGAFPAFLVRSVAFCPGWRAWVDARPAAVEVADHAFQGVVVPPGRHVVTLRYEPAAVRVGMYLTFIGAACLAGLLAAGRYDRARGTKEIGLVQSNMNTAMSGRKGEEGLA